MSYFTYRGIDAEGTTLYVGRATRKEVWRRFAEHAKRKGAEWYERAKVIVVYEHATHDSMRWHEQNLWYTHKPPYNGRLPGTTGRHEFLPIAWGEYVKDNMGRWHYTPHDVGEFHDL